MKKYFTELVQNEVYASRILHLKKYVQLCIHMYTCTLLLSFVSDS